MGPNIWNTVAQVGSGITLAAFIAAVAAWVYRVKSLEKVRLISTAPEAERARLVESALEFFPVDTSTLTGPKKVELALAQIRARADQSRRTAILVGLIAVLAAGVTVYAIAQNSGEKERRLKEIDKARGELQKKLDAEIRRSTQLVNGLGRVTGQADEMARSNPEVIRLRDHLEHLLAQFDSRYGGEPLSQVDDLRIRLARATAANAANRYREALSIVSEDDAKAEQRATETQISREVAVLMVRGDAFFGLNNWRQALTCYERISRLDRDNYKAVFNSGFCKDQLRQLSGSAASYNDSVALLTRLVEGGRSELENDLAAALNNRGNALYALGRGEEALKDYGKAIDIFTRLVEGGRSELENDLAGALSNRGNALDALGRGEEALKDLGKAIDIFTRLVEGGRSGLENDFAGALSNRGNALDALGRGEEALKDYGKAIDIFTRLVEGGRSGLENDLATALSNRGTTLGALGRGEEALKDLGKAVDIRTRLVEGGRSELENDLATALSNRGNALGALGRGEEALKDLGKAVDIRTRLVEGGRSELENDLAAALNNRGNALRALGRGEEALKDLGKAVDIFTRLVEEGRSGLENNLAAALGNRGNALRALGRDEEALKDLVPLTAIKDRKSYAASVKGFASSIWHFAMTFATDFEVQLNG